MDFFLFKDKLACVAIFTINTLKKKEASTDSRPGFLNLRTANIL